MSLVIILTSLTTTKKNFVEIRLHGRGGQGAWTASKILVEAALVANKYAQGFPEFGPERSGAPVRSFVRISDKKIDIHSGVYEADIIVVLDPTLLDLSLIDYSPGAVFILPSFESGDIAKKRLNNKNVSIWALDAVKIAVNEFGRGITNTVMLGGFAKATEEKIIPLEAIIEGVKRVLRERLPEEIVKKNINAVKKAFHECRKIQ